MTEGGDESPDPDDRDDAGVTAVDDAAALPDAAFDAVRSRPATFGPALSALLLAREAGRV